MSGRAGFLDAPICSECEQAISGPVYRHGMDRLCSGCHRQHVADTAPPADPGEAARLRLEVRRLQGEAEQARAEADRLRAQLAEMAGAAAGLSREVARLSRLEISLCRVRA